MTFRRVVHGFGLAASLSVAVLGSAMSSGPAFAQLGCQLPFSPQPPDGRTADEAAMRVGRDAMQAFIKRADEFLTCIEQETARAKAEFESFKSPTLEQQAVFKVKKDELDRRYDAGVDAQKAAADKFNEQLQIFRRRPDRSGAKPG